MIDFNLKFDSFVLSFSYGNYLQSSGGTDKFILSQQNVLHARKISLLHLFDVRHHMPFLNIKLPCWGIVADGKYNGVYTTAQILQFLQCYSKHQLVGIFLHHLMYLDVTAVTQLLDATVAPIFFYLHDYYSLCSQINLLTTPTTTCVYCQPYQTRCPKCQYGPRTLDRINQLKQFFARYPQLRFIAPSQTAQDIFLRTYPECNEKCVLIEHQVLEGNRATHGKIDHVAFIGMPHPKKGYLLWKKIITTVSGYYFYQLGRKTETLPGVTYFPVRFTQHNTNPMPNLLKQHKIGIVLLWSIWPETYSYTYYEALMANCFIITNPNSGNIAAQVLSRKNGIVLNTEEEVIELLQDKLRLQQLVQTYWQTNQAPAKLKENETVYGLLCPGSINKSTVIMPVPFRHNLISFFANGLYRLYQIIYWIFKKRK